MKAERQYKDVTSRTIQTKGNNGKFVITDNRLSNANQTKNRIHIFKSNLIQKDSVIEYDTTILKEGEIMYKGCNGEEVPKTGDDSKDWSGCYLSNTLSQAEGYATFTDKQIENIKCKEAKVSIWEAKLKKDISVLHFKKGYLERSDISDETKSQELKKEFEIDEHQSLQQGLFYKKGAYYYGLSSEDNEEDRELIIPWNKIEEVIEFKLLKKGTIKKPDFSITWSS